MGQATRQFKRKADGSLRMGSLAGMLGGVVQRAVATSARNVQVRADKFSGNIAVPPPPSKPIPKLSQSPYIGGTPYNKANTDLHKQIKSFYDSMQGGVDKLSSAVTGKTIDDAWHQADTLNVAAQTQKGILTAHDAAMNIGNSMRKKPFVAPERPDELTLQELQKSVDLALRDNTWRPDERMQIVKSYRAFIEKFVADDEEDLKSINNWKMQSVYKQLVKRWQQSVDAGKDTSNGQGGGLLGDFFGLSKGTQGIDDLSEFYDGPLQSSAQDDFGPGFILAADAGGWYKIEKLATLQHEIAVEARDNPAFAARLIAGMAAYGAYGSGTDKYAGQRIQYDKHGNPVAATFNVDDEKALGSFLDAIAKDQQMAMNGEELKPWDAIMDERAAQNSQIAATPSYGKQSGGGGGYRRYGHGYGGYGGGGGGGGGGVSYTDSDQLKQLINGIARSRLGYVLNEQQIAEFVAAYHSKEAAFVNARMGGMDGQQLDPESQAASWIEAHFRDSMAANQANNYISTLASFLLGGSFGSQS